MRRRSPAEWLGPVDIRKHTPIGYSQMSDEFIRADRYTSVFWPGGRSKEPPSVLLAKRMDALSVAIRQKDGWAEKVRDPEVVARWRGEAVSQGLDPLAADRVIRELDHLARTRVSAAGARPAPVNGCFESDTALSAELLGALQAGARELEGEGPPDYHPLSDDLVVDLLHPSLCPLVSDLTHVRADEPLASVPADGPRRFQWLPAEVDVGADGACTFASPINGLHPRRHSALTRSIERALSACLPLLEETLTELRRARARAMLSSAPPCGFDMYALWEPFEQWIERAYPEQASCAPEHMDELEDVYLDEYQETREGQLGGWPAPLPFAPPEPPPPDRVARLRGRRLQVIVKMSDVRLDGERTSRYPGGAWHCEGEPQECICATALCYYELANVADSRLQFRRACDEFGVEYEQDDERGVREVYGIELDGDRTAVLPPEPAGELICREGRAVAFNNVLQHRLAPFEAARAGAPAVRRVLAFFLVDPAVRIPSTAHVAPQQESYMRELLERSPLFARLPDALLSRILGLVPSVFSKEKADAVRLELMARRRRADEVIGHSFGGEFSLCEH